MRALLHAPTNGRMCRRCRCRKLSNRPSWATCFSRQTTLSVTVLGMGTTADVVGVFLEPDVSGGEDSVARAILNYSGATLVHRDDILLHENILQSAGPIGSFIQILVSAPAGG